MIYFINGLQWAGYKKFDWGIVGESACANSWGRALKTREPSLSIPCFAERRYGGVLDDEMLMALPPDYMPKAIAGMEALSKNGLRYPFPQYGIQQDVRAGMAVSYPGRAAEWSSANDRPGAERRDVGVTAADGARLTLRASRRQSEAGRGSFVSHGNGFAADGIFRSGGVFSTGSMSSYSTCATTGTTRVGEPANHDYAHMAGDIAAVRGAARPNSAPSRRSVCSIRCRRSRRCLRRRRLRRVGPVRSAERAARAGRPVREKMLAYLARLTEWAAARRAVSTTRASWRRNTPAPAPGGIGPPGRRRSMARSVLRPSRTANGGLSVRPPTRRNMYAQGVTVGLWPPRVAIACRPNWSAAIRSVPARHQPAVANQALAAEHGYDYAAIPGTGHLLQLEQPETCAAGRTGISGPLGIRLTM